MHAAISPDPQSGAILTPIFQSTTYIQESIEQYLERGYSYSRTNNPTVSTLEEKIAILEGVKHAHVIRLHEVLFINEVFYFVMEHAPGGSLVKYIYRATRKGAKKSPAIRTPIAR